MIHKLAERYAAWIVNKNPSNQIKSVAVYTYGIEFVLSTLICKSIIFLFAFLFNIAFEMLIYQIFFTSLRFVIGGVHGLSKSICIVLSVVVSLICVFASVWTQFVSLLVYLEMGLSISIIYTIAPVNHPNRDASQLKTMRFKKIARYSTVAS